MFKCEKHVDYTAIVGKKLALSRPYSEVLKLTSFCGAL